MDRRCEKLQLHRLHHTGSNNTAKYSRKFKNAIDVGLQKPGRYKRTYTAFHQLRNPNKIQFYCV